MTQGHVSHCMDHQIGLITTQQLYKQSPGSVTMFKHEKDQKKLLQTILISGKLSSYYYTLSQFLFTDCTLPVHYSLKPLKISLMLLCILKKSFQQQLQSTLLLKKVHVSKPICMHYSNTGLKIASLFLPHSYLCPPPISLSHFKSDRGSLDRRSLTLTQSLYIYTGR